jgi:hypothetical protein
MATNQSLGLDEILFRKLLFAGTDLFKIARPMKEQPLEIPH